MSANRYMEEFRINAVKPLNYSGHLMQRLRVYSALRSQPVSIDQTLPLDAYREVDSADGLSPATKPTG